MPATPVPDTDRTLAGLCFVGLSALFVTAIMLAAAMVEGYDFRNAAISDLGVFPETALLFGTTLVVVGLANVVGAFFFARLHRRRWLFWLSVAAAVGAAGAGLVPLDAGDLHGLFALLAFLGFNLQALGTAVTVRGVMRAMSLLAGGVGLVFVVAMALGDAGNAALLEPFGHGGTERLIVYPVMLWMVALGGYLLGGGPVVPPRDSGRSGPGRRRTRRSGYDPDR